MADAFLNTPTNARSTRRSTRIADENRETSMPTCTKGQIDKTVSGTVTLKIGGVNVKDITADKERASDKWDNCHCKAGQTYKELKCITATDKTVGEAVKGSFSPAKGITIEYDLTVDSVRNITNCEYE